MPSENTIYLAAIIFISALLGYLYLKFIDKDDEDSKISPEYLTGLKLLLNEQSDKAINLFSEIVQVDEETIETHLALGVLFRKQGKIDQAIKLHENIISKKELKEHHYYQALEELAEDYYSAGLYDKSEEIFKKLTDTKDHKTVSLTKLMQIYEYTCEWNKALSTVEKLNNINPSNEYRQNIPHYFCQISEKYISQNNLEKAELYIKKAKSTNSKSSRILFVSIQIALKKGKLKDALKIYKKLCEISDLGHQILLPDLIKSAKEKGQSEKVTEMIQEIYNNPLVANDHLAMLAIMELNIEEKIVMQSLYEFLANDIYFSELLNFNNMTSITELMNNELINNIREKLNHKSKSKFKYLCKNCGYKTIKLSWQCPTCRSWESSDPINFITNNI
jgi:lipopolysaccharide biosynthesis regulator YciM|tara:strand:+ start:172 stop:1344 length:1173 start_codon:yes stop_codon:yes gene_type:complete